MCPRNIVAQFIALFMAAALVTSAQTSVDDSHGGVALGRQISAGFSNAAAKNIPAVVIVRSTVVPKPEPLPPGQPPPPRRPPVCSGVLIDPDGYIVTSSVVVKDTDFVEVIVPTQSNRRYSARVLENDPALDLALIKVNGTDMPYARLGDSNTVRVGQWVLAIGAPFGPSESVTAGIISATNRTLRGKPNVQIIQTDTAINDGSNGGALVNLDGEVIGINSSIPSRLGRFDGIAYAVPINAVKAFLASAKSGKAPGTFAGELPPTAGTGALRPGARPTLGLIVVDGDETQPSVIVVAVSKGGIADSAGVQAGDIIININGAPAINADQVKNLTRTVRAGITIPLEVLRDDKKIRLKLQY